MNKCIYTIMAMEIFLYIFIKSAYSIFSANNSFYYDSYFLYPRGIILVNIFFEKIISNQVSFKNDVIIVCTALGVDLLYLFTLYSLSNKIRR